VIVSKSDRVPDFLMLNCTTDTNKNIFIALPTFNQGGGGLSEREEFATKTNYT
jgi:hypothetical protein